ncbi:TlpA family protein disulfide reductase [Thermodesulfobacteriota bacterium]
MVFKKPIKVISILVILFIIGGCAPETDVHIMKDAPDFTLKSLTGEKISLKDFKGNIVLVDFWATWCGPCLMSIPELVRLQDKYRGRGVVILGISLDDPAEVDNAQLQRFTEKYKMNYYVMRDDKDVMRIYLGDSAPIPTMCIINQDGKIVDTIIGFSPGEAEKTIERLL